MKNALCLATAVVAVLALSPPSAAQEMDASAGQSYLDLGIGAYDIFDNDDSAMDYRIEYTHGTPFFWKLQPFAAFEATGDGSVWAGGGVKADFMLAPNIYLAPSLGAGLYAQGGSDKDLGSALEFRTQIEGGYQFMNGHRVGVSLSHMSNADIGDHNPGAEMLNVYYHIPVNDLF